jgi:hypothetical protein
MKKIHLSRDQSALVDDEDYEALNRVTWSAQLTPGGIYYAVHTITKDEQVNERTRTRTRISMHQQILLWFGGIDHIDGNGLNNQRSNLRQCNASQNGGNRRKQKGTSSKYKGVSWSTSKKKWKAHIQVQGKLYHLGWFKEEEMAALAYNTAARKAFKDFAKVNEVTSWQVT